MNLEYEIEYYFVIVNAQKITTLFLLFNLISQTNHLKLEKAHIQQEDFKYKAR